MRVIWRSGFEFRALLLGLQCLFKSSPSPAIGGRHFFPVIWSYRFNYGRIGAPFEVVLFRLKLKDFNPLLVELPINGVRGVEPLPSQRSVTDNVKESVLLAIVLSGIVLQFKLPADPTITDLFI